MELSETYYRMKELPTRVITLIAISLSYPYPAKIRDVVDFVSQYKQMNERSIMKVVYDLMRIGLVRRVSRGVYELTHYGLQRLRWYWLQGMIPNEYKHWAIDTVKCKRRVKKEDGKVEVVYL